MDERTHARYLTDVDYFITQLEASPNSIYFLPLALAFNKLERYDETIALCISAVERFPTNCAAKTLLAEAFINKGELDEAKSLLFDVTAEDDNNYKALKLLGKIFKLEENSSEALKYLVGAYIRTPDDEEVRLMIEELGGSTNPVEIYEDRMRKRQQNVFSSEEDEEIRTYQNIDQKIRNAEMIMAELATDTSIGKAFFEEPMSFDAPMESSSESSTPTIEQEPTPTPTEATATPTTEEEENILFDKDELDKLSKALSKDEDKPDIISDNPEDFLPSVGEVAEEPEGANADVQNISVNLGEGELNDDILNQLFAKAYEAVDILEAKEKEQERLASLQGDSSTNDFLTALSGESASSDDNSEADFFAALSSEETGDDNSNDDFLAALSSQEVVEAPEIASENIEEVGNEIEASNLEAPLEATSEGQEEAKESVEIASENIEEAISLEAPIEATSEGQEEAKESVEIASENIEEAISLEAPLEATSEEQKEAEETIIKEDVSEVTQESTQPIEPIDKAEEPKKVSADDMLKMSYEDMLGDDDYNETNDIENEAMLKEMGEYAPFTQRDIMEEIFSEAGMSSEDMVASDIDENHEEHIKEDDISDVRDEHVEKLEALLSKVQKNKKSE